jgi:hypothetical protein
MDFSQSDITLGQIYVGSGRASDNMVLSCASIGIKTAGITTLTGNAVINCKNGIDLSGSGSLVANTIRALSGQTALIFNNSAVVADQNSFYLEPGATLYSGSGSGGYWALNAYNP